MNPAELHLFFEDFVRKLRDQGVICAITSGLACVHYGIAETTKDCDLLCHMESFDGLLSILEQTSIGHAACRYRGKISPPLDIRWHRGGWTSHFEWPTQPNDTTLDIFGRAVRQDSPWEHDLAGLYAGMNVVAIMKRTDRDKDWPFINSLGVQMLRSRDPRGWLHIFDPDALLDLQDEYTIPNEYVQVRPLLQLALSRDPTLRQALLAERHFWQELDRIRIRLYRAALRPFVLAMGRIQLSDQADLRKQHAVRLACAEPNLAINPLAAHGIDRFINDALEATKSLIRPELLEWLPNVRNHFTYLIA